MYFLTTTYGHLPLPSYKPFFPDDAAFSILLLKASQSKYISFAEIIHLANSQIRGRVCVLMILFALAVGEAKSANKSV